MVAMIATFEKNWRQPSTQDVFPIEDSSISGIEKETR